MNPAVDDVLISALVVFKEPHFRFPGSSSQYNLSRRLRLLLAVVCLFGEETIANCIPKAHRRAQLTAPRISYPSILNSS